jgi:hypothetical protein
MRRVTVLMIVSLCIAAPPAGAGVVCARRISIDNSQYSPEIAGKAARSTVFVVCWANEDGVNHTASSNSGLFDTDTIPPGTGGGGTFYGAGKYPFHCENHPFMAGTFRVRPAVIDASITLGDSIHADGRGVRGHRAIPDMGCAATTQRRAVDPVQDGNDGPLASSPSRSTRAPSDTERGPMCSGMSPVGSPARIVVVRAPSANLPMAP